MEEVSYAEVSNCILLLCFKGCAIYDVLYSAVTKMSRALKVKVKIYIKRQRIYVYVHVASVQYIFSRYHEYILCAVVSIKYILCKFSDISS